MGRSGTDVAREAGVVVLLDDSFAAIAAAVRLGRSVYQNIRKVLIYLFSHNIAELVPILAATFVGFPLVPLTATQILAIDLGSDVLPALALGAEPPEHEVMDQPPRARKEPLFSATVVRRFLFLGLIQAVGICVAFFWRVQSAEIPFSAFTASTPAYREAITMAQAGTVLSQFFNGLTVRSDRQSVFQFGLLPTRARSLPNASASASWRRSATYRPYSRSSTLHRCQRRTGRWSPRSAYSCSLPTRSASGSCAVAMRRSRYPQLRADGPDESHRDRLRTRRFRPEHPLRRRGA